MLRGSWSDSSPSIWTRPWSQSPEGVGRAVAALAADPDLLAMTGETLSVSAIADRYGVDVST